MNAHWQEIAVDERRNASGTPADFMMEVAADDVDAPRFRILKRGSWRRAIKLEGIFWTLLELAAKRHSLKLTDYVREVLGEASSSRNQTSDLRVHAARWLHDRLEETERKLEEASPQRLIQAVPLPAFIIGHKRGLIAHNSEFASFIRSVADKEQIAEVSQARLTLDAPLAAIIETLRATSKRALDCGFQIVLNERRLKGRVRVSLVPGSAGRTDIMGFVLGTPSFSPRG